MVTYLGSLVQLYCGEGGKLQTNITGMCGECSQCMDHTGFAPIQSGVYFLGLCCSGSRVPAGTLSKVGPGICALPGLNYSGSQVLHKGTYLVGLPFLCLSQVQEAQVTGCLASALSQVGHVS